MKNILLVFFLLATFSACQRVVDINLKSVDKKYVIEGIVTDSTAPYSIHITQTKDFQEDNTYSGVSGAFAVITDVESNIIDTLAEEQQGIYFTKKIIGTPGHTYQMQIKIDKEVFTAISTMPHKVNFDSMYVLNIPFFGKNIKAVVPVFKDPKGVLNYYHIEQYKNGKLDQNIYVDNDDFSDGKIYTRPLIMMEADSSLVAGDTAMIELQCTDAAMYKYWYSMMQATGASQGTPTNPVTNIVGGALGYFSANTIQRKTIVVQK